MKSRLLTLVCCVFALMLVAGCLGGGSASGSSGSGVEVAGLPGGDGGGILGGGGDGGVLGDGGGTGGILGHTPEPATVALLGSGLLAYAFLRRKKLK